ncbi:hypothetical protein [Spirosoma pollinicola]|uniref:DUF2158 domain-containing protein n=1 Tax=Spirosoma pollinicola TaxID=2057025 RepID=A0A2K8YVZ7_9BACT|nr:hypothetical protein [Spirosoma pollinicola]AUD01797.1 hypothetical protein CWM47_08170 [Spirosoma pollinicola]
MADLPIQFQPGDQVALLDGSSPMTVKSVKDNGRTVTCESSSEDNPTESDYDATKLTKLHSSEQTGSKA